MVDTLFIRASLKERQNGEPGGCLFALDKCANIFLQAMIRRRFLRCIEHLLDNCQQR